MPAQREHLVDVSVGKLQQQSPLRTQELPIQKRTEKDEVPVVREGQQLLAGLLRQRRPMLLLFYEELRRDLVGVAAVLELQLLQCLSGVGGNSFRSFRGISKKSL